MNFLKKLFSSNKDEKSIKSESRLTNDNNDENIVGILKSEKDDRTLENNELIIEEEKKASKIEISEKINSNIKISDMEYFEERYAEVNLEEHRKIIDDSIILIDDYFKSNKIEKKIGNPTNHPLNLQQVFDEGYGFVMHSNAVNIDENTAILFLAFALNEFFITNYDFKLYADTKPEFPLRGMTLKFKKDNRYFSLYPYEFSLKVWNNQARFEELLDNVEHNLKNMPSIDDILN